jgi:hypothetical protein
MMIDYSKPPYYPKPAHQCDYCGITTNRVRTCGKCTIRREAAKKANSKAKAAPVKPVRIDYRRAN